MISNMSSSDINLYRSGIENASLIKNFIQFQNNIDIIIV